MYSNTSQEGRNNPITARLTLGSLELVSYNGTDDPGDDLVVYPKLPGNGKLDLNPRGDFRVAAGKTLVLQLDPDANKSIHIVQHGNAQTYEFRPVDFVDIVTDAFHERYVMLHGVVQNIDADSNRFALCDTGIPVRSIDDRLAADSRGCIEVDVPDGTPVFNENGMPALFTDLAEGGEATVFGRLVKVRGVLDVGTDTLFTSLVVVDTDSSGASEAISVSELVPGQEANVYGSEALDGCFDADTVIVFETGPAST